MLNVVMSPSKLSHPRQHVYAGRVGVITSYLSLAFGYAHAWTDPFLPQGFSMGLSVVGVLQLMFTTGGLLYIRQALRIRQIADALRPHDEAAREAAVREVNRWTEPTPSLLLVFKFHMPPLLTDLHGRPAERLDSRSAAGVLSGSAGRSRCTHTFMAICPALQPSQGISFAKDSKITMAKAYTSTCK